jgi:hypothetical protein
MLSLCTVALGAATAAAHAATGSTTALTATADAYVTAQYPNANTGAAQQLRTDASPVVRTYVRFTVPAAAGTVAGATLRVHVNSGSSAGFQVRRVASTTWRESTITHANAPAVASGTIGSSGPVAGGTWASIDVSAAVTAPGAYSFALTTTGATALSLASRESGANAPTLVIRAGGSPPPSAQPSLPIRAAFYYPWYPETWTVRGQYTHFHPSLGYYSSTDASVIRSHVDAMRYAGMDAGIVSWWGRGSRSDTRMGALLHATESTSFRWAVYYENESTGDPSSSQIASDVAYIRDTAATSPAYLRVDGRFVVFVYAGAGDGCAMADRWRAAEAAGAYVLLKVFPGFRTCGSQPDGWHQYGPATAASDQAGYSYSISPGFWLADEAAPRLARDLARWRQNVSDMVASQAPWQLVTTFNEWGEGTAAESATEWPSPSGYGAYLDVLHAATAPGTTPPRPPGDAPVVGAAVSVSAARDR